jgi:hypothetical protein
MWKESIATVQNLQDLLMSCKLYRTPVACAAPSAGFESGHIFQNFNNGSRSTLPDGAVLLPKSQASYDNRMAMWHEMIPKVWKDCEDNEDAA